MTNEDIKKYQKNLADMKTTYVRKEEQKISQETQLNTSVQKLKDLGFEPEDIAEVLLNSEKLIADLEEELKKNLAEAERILMTNNILN